MRRLAAAILAMTMSVSLVACSTLKSKDNNIDDSITSEEIDISYRYENSDYVLVEDSTDSSDETSSSDSVDPNVYWGVTEDGEKVFHIDEYAKSLGYAFLDDNPMVGCFLYPGHGQMWYDCETNTFEYHNYSAANDLIATYSCDLSDSTEKALIEYNDCIGYLDLEKINNVITTLYYFANVDSGWEVAPEAPEGWTISVL